MSTSNLTCNAGSLAVGTMAAIAAHGIGRWQPVESVVAGVATAAVCMVAKNHLDQRAPLMHALNWCREPAVAGAVVAGATMAARTVIPSTGCNVQDAMKYGVIVTLAGMALKAVSRS